MGDLIESEIGVMPNDWRITTVQKLVDDDVIAKPIDGNHGNIHPKNSDFVAKGIPFIMASDVVNNSINLTSCSFISKELSSTLQKGFSYTGDVLLTHKATLGRAAIVPKLDTEYIMLTPQVTYYRILKHNILSNKFLLYYFKSPAFQSTLEVHGSSGSTRAYVGITAQRALPILLPPLPEQRAIAEVLSSLDDKIDLLHRQNKTLESMAEALFRQWFVEEAKEEWEVVKLDQILSVKGGTTPSTTESRYWDGEICWTSPKDITNLNGIFLFDTDRKITPEGLKKVSSGLLPTGTLLMSSRAPVGVLAFTEVPVAINQGYIAIIDDKGIDKRYIYLWLKINMDYVQSYANGSTFMEISKSAFRSLELSVPPRHLLSSFLGVINPLFEKIRNNEKQVLSLIKLRDTLLPKLMSGEVRVKI